MRVTNKGAGQRGTGIFRSPDIRTPALVKQEHDFSVGNSDVRHFTCNSCKLPFSQNMPAESAKHKSRLTCPNCYTEQVG
jgi:hypothetical protein